MFIGIMVLFLCIFFFAIAIIENEVALNVPKKPKKVTKDMTKDEFDIFLDEWIPHYLWYPDMLQRLEKVSTKAELRSFDPMDYMGASKRRGVVPGSRRSRVPLESDPFNTYKTFSSGGIVSDARALKQDYRTLISSLANSKADIEGISSELKIFSNRITADRIYPPNPPVYLYADYDIEYQDVEVDQLLDSVSVFRTKRGTGKPIAVRTRIEHTSHGDADHWACIKHEDVVMWTRRIDDNEDHYPKIGKNFKCSKCEKDKIQMTSPQPVTQGSLFSKVSFVDNYGDL